MGDARLAIVDQTNQIIAEYAAPQHAGVAPHNGCVVGTVLAL